MDVVEILKIKIQKACAKLGKEVSLDDIIIERTKEASHGDYATNAAMKMSRLFGMNPRALAEEIIKNIEMDGIDHIEIAGPGFINFFMSNDSLTSVVEKIINEEDDYGTSPKKNIKVNVEFVSANPTGDLHVGHARGAAVGDSLCRILSKAGYDVTREYYVNDAGSQITHLAESIDARYREALGLPFRLPEDGYHGEDVKIIAEKIISEIGDKALSYEEPLKYFARRGIDLELEKIIRDLDVFRVKFDVFTSERDVRKDGAIEKEIAYLKDNVYEQDGALYLATSRYLDDKDRVIRKSNGEYTYFITNIS